MTNIVTMSGVELPDGAAPHAEVLDAAEELLSMVKDGVITGVVIMAQRRDGMYRSYECGPFDLEPMLGHMARQAYRLTKLAEVVDGDA